MQSRMVMTSFWRDEYIISLPRDERDFFLYLLTSPDIAFAGIGLIPEKVMVMDLGFSRDSVQFCKKQLEKTQRIILYENWVCLPNFWDHNPMMRSDTVIEATGRFLERLSPRVFEHFNIKLKELGAPMSLDDYMDKRRRNQAKKQIRKAKPWLKGPQIDDEVDRVLGLSDSGKMDWAAIQKPTASAYPTLESVTPQMVIDTATEFGIRPYALYWFFTQKLTKLQASGRTKNDYFAFLKEVAGTVLGKELSDDKKKTAAMLWAKHTNVTITPQQIDKMIFTGEL